MNTQTNCTSRTPAPLFVCSAFVFCFFVFLFSFFLSHCRFWLSWPPPLSSKCRKLKRPQSKTLLVGQESLSLHSTVWWDLRAAGSCCQQSFFAKKKKKKFKIKYNTHPISQRSTPCCDGYSARWCPQVKGSPSGWVVEAGKSLSWAWRDLRRKTPVGISGKGKLSHAGWCFVQKFDLQNTYISLIWKNSTFWAIECLPVTLITEIPSACYHLSVQYRKRLRLRKTQRKNITEQSHLSLRNHRAQYPNLCWSGWKVRKQIRGPRSNKITKVSKGSAWLTLSAFRDGVGKKRFIQPNVR